MDTNILLIIIAVVVILNIILIINIMKSKKDQTESNPVEVSTEGTFPSSPFLAEEDSKTEVLDPYSQGQKAPVEEVEAEVKNLTEEEIVKEDMAREEIADLQPLPKVEDELSIQAQKEEIVDETVILAAEAAPPPEPAPVMRTIMYEVKNEQREYEWNEAENLVIGRDPKESDLIIEEDLFIGRKHAMVYKKQDNYYVVDLDSKNGTFVDGIALKGTIEIGLDKPFTVGKTEIKIR